MRWQNLEYQITEVTKRDSLLLPMVKALLQENHIRSDRNLDYTAAMVDDDYHVIATGSLFDNTLRCLAVSKEHQGEALMNQLLSHLVQVQYQRGNTHLFLYTKCDTAKLFGTMGFYEIARIPEENLVFMENRREGFSSYLERLEKESKPENFVKGSSTFPNPLQQSAIVMNANPFTLGHQYLIETAASRCDLLHLFLVSEDSSFFPFSVREKLVKEGTRKIPNLIYHPTGSYLISNAIFPAYFQRDEDSVIVGQAKLDAEIFSAIAAKLSIQERFVGDEPASRVTAAYNQVLKASLPKHGIRLRVIPRMERSGVPISASTVRECMKNGDFEALKSLLPETSYRFLLSEEAIPILVKLRAAKEVRHY